MSSDRHDQFLRLFTEHEPAIRAFVRSLLPTREDAGEVLQEVAIVLWNKFADFSTGEDFRKWAFGVAKFKVLAFRRDKARDRHIFGDKTIELLAIDASTATVDLERQREALNDCLQMLTSEQRELVNAAYAPGVRIDEMAQEIGRTAMAVYKSLHRIRMALVECTQQALSRKSTG